MASNPHGVKVQSLDWSHKYAPTTMTYHGIVLKMDGREVGRITSWNPQPYGRDGEHVYELSKTTFGRPVDYVPGKNNTYTISCNRVEVWLDEFERAIGFDDVWVDLCDQRRPFTITETLYKGDVRYREWTYTGCWITSKNPDAYDAEGNAKIIVSAEISYVARTKTL